MGPKLIGWVFTVIGVVCWIIGAYSYVATRDFAAHATAVEGTVVELQVQRSSHGITYMPVVEYLDLAGRRHTLFSPVASNPPAFLVDQKVKVLYRPDDPEFPLHARIESSTQLWGSAMFMVLFGSLFFVVGVTVLLLVWKGRQLFFGQEISLEGRRGRYP